MFNLPINSRLYRATEYLDELTVPHYCQDTGKTGCYFSFYDPFLADSMVLEYNKSLFRGEFITRATIQCYVGKYKCLTLPEGQQNVNHIDFDIGALTLYDNPEICYAEVFLTENELSKLQMKDFVVITPDEIFNKYNKLVIRKI